MKAIFQTVFNDQEGNCLQAAIASVLEVPLDTVPHFALEPEHTWWQSMNSWMQARHGLAVICVVDGWDAPKVYHLITGLSPRGVEHATVGYAGEIVHDPHPRSDVQPLQRQFRKWWFFVPVDPARSKVALLS
jgi:hypothetical protein